jgi:hypothetical protein
MITHCGPCKGGSSERGKVRDTVFGEGRFERTGKKGEPEYGGSGIRGRGSLKEVELEKDEVIRRQ